MKKLVLLCLALTLALSAVGCSDKNAASTDASTGTASPTVATEPLDVPFEGSVTGLSCTIITVDTEGFKTREGQPITDMTVTDVDGMAPTVLDAAKQIFDANEISYEIGDGVFTSIKGKTEKESDGYKYVWEFKLNGGDSFAYADSTLVSDNDQIVFYYTPYKIAE